jgi:hypothetical protein
MADARIRIPSFTCRRKPDKDRGGEAILVIRVLIEVNSGTAELPASGSCSGRKHLAGGQHHGETFSRRGLPDDVSEIPKGFS